MKTFYFSPIGISLNEMIRQCGIEQTEKDGKKYLTYEGKTIPRPPFNHAEEAIRERLGVDIQYRLH